MKSTPTAPLLLSPSVYHQHLLSKTSPAISYKSGPVAAWQARARRKLRQLLGFTTGPRCALQPRRLWLREHELGTIEKIVFRSEPGADVPGYLCLPRKANPPYPLVICLQGHTTGMHLSIAVDRADEVTPIQVEGDRDFALGCLRRGFAAFCLEQRAFGERLEKAMKQASPLGCLDASLQALMLGKTLIGERVYDIDRALDYLATRTEVDKRRIGIMGNSSGGAMSLYAAALLPRLSYAMPSCYFCTFRASVMAMNHCEENYIPGLLRHFEMADIAALIAPRPLVIVAGEQDPMFPIAATRKAFSQLRGLYAKVGARGSCHLVVGSGGHRFYADQAWPALTRVLAGHPAS